MWVPMIPIAVDALRTVLKGLVKIKELEIRRGIETIQNTAFLKSARINIFAY